MAALCRFGQAKKNRQLDLVLPWMFLFPRTLDQRARY